MTQETITPEEYLKGKKPRGKQKSERRPKYRNIKTRTNGMVFDSKLEAARYGELELLEKAGAIEHLERQVRVPLEVNGARVCVWVVDHEFYDCERKTLVWEDVKGYMTRDAALKIKLAKALYPNVLIEIWKG